MRLQWTHACVCVTHVQLCTSIQLQVNQVSVLWTVYMWKIAETLVWWYLCTLCSKFFFSFDSKSLRLIRCFGAYAVIRFFNPHSLVAHNYRTRTYIHCQHSLLTNTLEIAYLSVGCCFFIICISINWLENRMTGGLFPCWPVRLSSFGAVNHRIGRKSNDLWRAFSIEHVYSNLYCQFDGYNMYNWLSNCQVNHNHILFCRNEPIHRVCGDIIRTMNIELCGMKFISWWFGGIKIQSI